LKTNATKKLAVRLEAALPVRYSKNKKNYIPLYFIAAYTGSAARSRAAGY